LIGNTESVTICASFSMVYVKIVCSTKAMTQIFPNKTSGGFMEI
jgi:uncharacterized protein YsxB (DUF464 family)